MTNQVTFGVLHLFSGIGGGALGMQESTAEWRGINGNFFTLAGIDCDPEACRDFERLTGAPSFQMDLFSRDDYMAFHGHAPPSQWQEVKPTDIRATTGGIAPDVIFTSPPCKGFSGLLPSKSAKSQKYQALNRLTVRGIKLALEAFADDLPSLILLENVPRITSRGAGLLLKIKRILADYGYLFHEGNHDCGEIGGLGQRRKRYLLIARNPKKVTSFVYQPPKLPLKTIGDVIGLMPMPNTPISGPMHRLPRLQWKTWVRLALIPPGGDWRDLENIAPRQYHLEYLPRGGGSYGVQKWDTPSTTVTGKAKVNGSNAASIADPRLSHRKGRHPAVYQVVRFDQPGPCVTGTRFGSGASAISNPRTGGGYSNKFQLLNWDNTASTVTGTPDIQSGAQSIVDPRLGCKCRSGSYGVQCWDNHGKTVTGASDVHSGSAAVADPRIPKDTDSGVWLIIAEDGTWHRPLTTLELAALQGLPTVMADGSPLVLAGKSDARWRERIGNAVPPPAAKAIGIEMLLALIPSIKQQWTLGATPVWVQEENWTEETN